MQLPSWFITPFILLLGCSIGWSGQSYLLMIASIIADAFMKILKLFGLPIVFCSLVSTSTGFSNLQDLRRVGIRTVQYTMLTTGLAAVTALGLFLMINPVAGRKASDILGGMKARETPVNVNNALDSSRYVEHLWQVLIPGHLFQPFINAEVTGVLFLAVVFSVAILSLPTPQLELLHHLFEALFHMLLAIVSWVVGRCAVIAVAAFLALFAHQLQLGQVGVTPILGYLLCIVLSNVIQAFLVLPCLLLLKGISPMNLFSTMSRALFVAFFAKSSSGAFPVVLDSLQARPKTNPRIVQFCVPLCISTNMNGCAAFILVTVLFMTSVYGELHSPFSYGLWLVLSCLAAVGNAGVPMGCFVISVSILASLQIPQDILYIVILPFYSFIDMLESAVNVWSDACVTVLVNHDYEEERMNSMDGVEKH